MKSAGIERAKPSTAKPAEAKPFFAVQRQVEEGAEAEAGAFFQPTTVQTALRVGRPDDPLERQADRMADQVVQRQASGLAPMQPLATAQALQRKCATCGEEEAVQREVQEVDEEPTVQAQLIQRQSDESEEDIQRKCAACAEAESLEQAGEGDAVQAKAPVTPQVTPQLAGRMQRAEGHGRPLEPVVRNQMEGSFGMDFSEVRIHTGHEAAALSTAIQARAFTHGSHIFFNQHEYRPANRDGQHLLAHELTHTIQQGAVARRKPMLQREEGDAADLAEQLAASEREREDANDPRPAEQAREEAAADAAQAEQQAQEGLAEAEPPEEALPTAEQPAAEPAVATPATQAPDAVSGEIGDAETPLGPAGQQLANDSANACQQAANDAQTLANNEQAHDPAADLVADAEAAVEPPAEENQSRANAGQVAAVEGTETPDADPEAMRREMDQAIADSVPSSIESMNEFAAERRGQVVGNVVLAETAAQVGEVQGAYGEVQNAPVAELPTPGVPLTPLPAAPDTPNLNLGEDAVPELAEEQTEVAQYTDEANQLWAREGVTPDLQAEIEQVDSGPLAEANQTRADLDEQVATQPAEVQQFATEQQQQVTSEMQAEEADARNEMQTARQQQLDASAGEQVRAKTDLELKREAVTTWINNRYEQAKTLVDEKLAALETESMAAFDRGQQQYSRDFEQNVNTRVRAWKRERYSGMFGGVKWLKDKLFGIDHFPAITEIFRSEREAYVASIDRLIGEINTANEAVIQVCRDEVALAKTEIEEYVAQLAPDLQEVGQQALAETQTKLAELDAAVEAKKEELQQKLCDKREAAIQAIDEKIEAMKSEMGGLVAQLGALLLEAAKKFFKWALEKIGANPDTLLSIIDKGATVLKALFTDPIGFFGNLIRAVGTGIGNFVTNIAEWLKRGLMEWLLGNLADSGLQLPETLDLKGIMHLGLQVAGLTWAAIRARVVRALGAGGEAMMAAAETGVEMVSRVLREGPIALWHILVEEATSLKETVMDGIRNWAIVEIVKRGIAQLVLMLNPVGAIVKAIQMIYSLVMFFVDNWQRIVDFVSSIFDSITNIARGAVGQAAGFIERAMGRTIPMMLSFLSRFVGLSGIGRAVRGIIARIQRPFQRILDRVVGFLLGPIRRFAGRAMGAVRRAGGRLVQWWQTRSRFRAGDGQTHQLFFKGNGPQARLTVASDEMAIEQFLTHVAIKANALNGAPKQQALAGLQRARSKKDEVTTTKSQLAAATQEDQKNVLFSSLQRQVNEFGVLLSPLFAYLNTGEIPPAILPPMPNGVKARAMRAKFVSHESTGKTPKGESSDKHAGTLSGWSALGPLRSQENWVKMHLLHHRLGGKATDANLTPAKSSLNQQFYRNVESKALTTVGTNNQVIWYKVKINYHADQPDFIQYIEASYGLHDPQQGWKEQPPLVTWSANVVAPSLAGAAAPPLAINESGKTLLKRFVCAHANCAGEKLTDRFVNMLVEERNKPLQIDGSIGGFTPYRGLNNVLDRLQRRYPDQNDLIRRNMIILTYGRLQGQIIV